MTPRRSGQAAPQQRTVALMQMTVPGYRVRFVTELRRRCPLLQVAAGEHFFDATVQTTKRDGVVDLVLRNRFLFGRRLAFQSGYRAVFRSACVLIVELNPRTVSTWLLLVEARIRRVPVIVWGHFAGRDVGATNPGLGRRWQVKLAGRVLAYTDSDAQRFATLYPSCRIDVAPNATESADEVVAAASAARSDFVYVGRLVETKRIDLILIGFLQAAKAGLVPRESRLVIVGEGPERASLEAIASNTELEDRVRFQAATYESSSLNEVYATAIAGICGGPVGLNLTQSLSRGVPFVYPPSAPHGPEVSMAIPGVNAFPFSPSSAEAVADAMREVAELTRVGEVDHSAIQVTAVSRHSVEVMVEGFLAAIQAALRAPC